MITGNYMGIQEPITVPDILENLPGSKLSDPVMKQWIFDHWKAEEADITWDTTRVQRVTVGSKTYRYQCQKASETQGYPFGENTLQEDRERKSDIVLFKQQVSAPSKYNFWYIPFEEWNNDPKWSDLKSGRHVEIPKSEERTGVVILEEDEI